MDHSDHVGLIRDGVAGSGKTWADLGCGDGAFTLALADLLGPGAVIHAVDRDARALERLRERMAARVPATRLEVHRTDLRDPLSLPPLDGVVMANSLHFVRDKARVLQQVRAVLVPDGRFILVEYEADRGNPWVPHPLSFGTWRSVAAGSGLRETRRLAAVPSSFLGSIYAALSIR